MTLPPCALAAEKGGPAAAAGDSRALGERMYRDGLLSDGTPLRGYVKGDVEVDSTVFSCSNCHTRSGLGSVEGQVASPPVNGTTLYNKRYQYKDYIKNIISEKRGVPRTATPLRPAYTDETLADAIRGGMSPNGRPFSPVMPRYSIGDRDMRILADYLRSLSSAYSPGVTETEMHIATIVGEGVPASERDAMVIPLERLAAQSRQAASLKKSPKYAKFARMLDESFFRTMRLSVWELKGSPTSWKAQLEEHYRKDPPFILMGGLVNGDWKPVHDFCEERQLPNLYPLTDFPVVSESSWYTYYFTRGYYQEGETAARFASGGGTSRVIQLVTPSRDSARLAEGAAAAWGEKGHGTLETVTLPGPGTFDAAALRKVLETARPDTLLVWGGSEALTALADPSLAGLLPARVILSSSQVGSGFTNLPDRLKERIFFTYPYRLPREEKNYADFAKTFLTGKMKLDDKRIASRTYSMIHVFLLGLKELKLDFYRDTLLDVISMRQDQTLPDFERLSFGPGQRYSSKGCYIVQVATGSRELIRKSDWVVF